MSQQAQKAEANGTTVTATWRNREWTAPSPDHWPWAVLEAVDDEKFTRALRGLLSETDYEAFKALNPTVTDGGELLEQLVKAAGAESTGE